MRRPPCAAAPATPGCFGHDVELDPDWRIGTKPNGGYLLAVLATAAADVAAPVTP
jgi:hypothetical protein